METHPSKGSTHAAEGSDPFQRPGKLPQRRAMGLTREGWVGADWVAGAGERLQAAGLVLGAGGGGGQGDGGN